LSLHITSSLMVFPHHLSYFNELSQNRFLLADSNIDWGQDLLFLQKDIVKQHNNYNEILGDCSGVIQPNDLNINLKPIPKTLEELSEGKYLIYLSIHRFLNKSEINPQGLYPWLLTIKPQRKVGSSILVFEYEK
jgi:hypothetical protein